MPDARRTPTPTEADPTGDWYAFEKGAEKTGGGEGFADVWKRGHFGWEYKGKHKDLAAAYQQLLQYREALENPPLLVVCDLDRFEVHTNFTDTVKRGPRLRPRRPRERPREPLRVLRAVMCDPEDLRPGRHARSSRRRRPSSSRAGRRAADRGHEPHAVAHFLIKLLFCMFAEDAGLLPGPLRTADRATAKRPDRRSRPGSASCSRDVATAAGCSAPSASSGSTAGCSTAPSPAARRRTRSRLLARGVDARLVAGRAGHLRHAVRARPRPEQALQLGAHYTGRASIERLVEPVVMAPLRRDFEEMKAERRGACSRRASGHDRRRRPTEKTRGASSRRSWIGCAASACSTRPAAPATSSTSRCSRSRTWSTRRSSGAR